MLNVATCRVVSQTKYSKTFRVAAPLISGHFVLHDSVCNSTTTVKLNTYREIFGVKIHSFFCHSQTVFPLVSSQIPRFLLQT